MADDQRTVLVSVDIDADKAIKEILELNKDVAALKESQKELDRTTEEGAAEYELLAAAIRNNNKEIGERRRVVENSIKAEEAQNGSLKEMRSTIAVLSQQYALLSKAERESAAGEDLQKKLAATTEEVKKIEQAYGDYRRSVGNYEKAALGFVKTNNALTDSLISNAAAGNSLKQSLGIMAQGVKQAGTAFTALLSNPFILIFTGIIKVVQLVADAMKRNEESTKKLSAAFQGFSSGIIAAFEPVAKFIANVFISTLDNLSAAFNTVLDIAQKVFDFFGAQSLSSSIDTIKSAAAASRELANAEYELQRAQRESVKIQKDFEIREEKLKQVRDDTTKTIQERITANDELGDVINDQLREELKIAQLALDVANLRIKADGESADALDEQAQALTTIADIQNRLVKQESEQLRARASLQKEANDKALELAEKRLTAETNLRIEQLKAEAGYNSTDFKVKQQYAAKEFALSQDLQRKLIELRKSTNKNYKAELDTLDAQLTAFRNKQLIDANTYNAQLIGKLDTLLQKNVDEQINSVNEKYNNAVKNLSEIQIPVRTNQTEEDFVAEMDAYTRLVFDNAQTIKRLEEQRQQEIRQIRLQGEQQTAALINNQVADEYNKELAIAADNEQKKLQVQIDAVNKEIELRKAAGLDVYEQEAKLRTLTATLYRSQLDTELLNKELTAKQRYELTKKELDDEAALYEGNEQALAEIDAAQMENYQEYLNARTEAFGQYADAIMGMATQFNALLSAGEAAQTKKYEKENKAKKDDLKKRLDAGLISQENYDAQVAEADAELDKKKAEIAKKQAIREKALNIFAVGIDTAKGIMKAVAESPLTFGLPWSAFVAATGALQIATILAQPLPEAARGAYVRGASHANGGVEMELEGGEVVINKKSSQKYLPILSAINEDGGGVAFTSESVSASMFAPAIASIQESGGSVPFMSPYSDGGYLANSGAERMGGITYEEVYTAMSDAVENIQVVATIEDIRREDRKYTIIESRAQYR